MIMLNGSVTSKGKTDRKRFCLPFVSSKKFKQKKSTSRNYLDFFKFTTLVGPKAWELLLA